MNRLTLLTAIATITCSDAFVPSKSVGARPTTELEFGIPTFQPKKDDGEKEGGKPQKKIDAPGLFQLITAGMGAPFLGDFQGVEEETGKFMFSLEANNLVDSDGNSKQTSMPYFESGWVDEADEQKNKENGFKFPWQK